VLSWLYPTRWRTVGPTPDCIANLVWLTKVAIAGAQVCDGLAGSDEEMAGRAIRKLHRLVTGLRAEQAPSQESGSAIGPPCFIFDRLFLAAVWRHLARAQVGGFHESFCFASGPQVGSGTFVVTQIVEVEFSEQTAGSVKVKHASNIEAMQYLDELGLGLLAHLHSHPGSGPWATQPSLTDHRFQDRMERGGLAPVGAIFDRNGEYVRFFAGQSRRFAVQLVGSGIEEVEEHVFRIPLAKRAVQRPDSDGGGTGRDDGPSATHQGF
jgi:hypothetical protein